MTPAVKTVLIADDDKLILSSFRFSLTKRGYTVLLAEDGGAALDHLERTPVDIAFLDVLMPEKEGLETLLEIRKRFHDLPVYVMSGGYTRGKQDFLEIALKFGATGVIRKPFTLSQLYAIVEGTPHTSSVLQKSA